jgi:hypothetical protein
MTNSKNITDQVRSILWHDWDPINVRALNGPADEYDAYIPAVVRMLDGSASIEAISRHLERIEAEEMNLTPDTTKTRRVAMKLIALLAE